MLLGTPLWEWSLLVLFSPVQISRAPHVKDSSLVDNVEMLLKTAYPCLDLVQLDHHGMFWRCCLADDFLRRSCCPVPVLCTARTFKFETEGGSCANHNLYSNTLYSNTL